VAFVVPVDGFPVTAEALLDYCRERLAGFKIPVRIRLCDELPKTTTGKLDRRALAALAENGGADQ
jgi:fatty-acyl-CoA synthase